MNNSAYKKKYDSSLEYNIPMYDRLPYVKDDTVCGPDKIQLFSGNVIKNYQFHQDEPFYVNTQDEKTKGILLKKEKEIMNVINQEREDYITHAIEEGLSAINPDETSIDEE